MSEVQAILEQVYDHKDIDQLARSIVNALERCERPHPKVVWLKGNLGAGKTTLVKHLLYALGIDRNVPVQSPTFTYLQCYRLDGREALLHIDLYRLDRALDVLEFMGYEGWDIEYIFIEWPERLVDSNELAPDFVIEIESAGDFEKRRIKLMKKT